MKFHRAAALLLSACLLCPTACNAAGLPTGGADAGGGRSDPDKAPDAGTGKTDPGTGETDTGGGRSSPETGSTSDTDAGSTSDPDAGSTSDTDTDGDISGHTVTFVDDGGKVLRVETVADGADATPPTVPARNGYAFTGWQGAYTAVRADATVRATYRLQAEGTVFLTEGRDAYRALHGLNGGPLTGWGLFGEGAENAYIDASDLYRATGAKWVRLHDTEFPFGGEAIVDYHVFLADTSEGHAAYFAATDAYVESILAVCPDAQIIFRLGESIGLETGGVSLNPYAFCPKDFASFAAYATEVARHYTAKYPQVNWYFEIWNEPNNGKTCFAAAPNGTTSADEDAYHRLYCETAAALAPLKAGVSNLRIGGPAASGGSDTSWEYGGGGAFIDRFLSYIDRWEGEHGTAVPLDFYSYHWYGASFGEDPDKLVADAAVLRGKLDCAGHGETRLLLDEWNLTYDPAGAAETTGQRGAGFALAMLLAMQSSDLDAACYYDVQMCGIYNGLWYLPYTDVVYRNAAALLGAWQTGGIGAYREALRGYLAACGAAAGSAPAPLATYDAFRFYEYLRTVGRAAVLSGGTDTCRAGGVYIGGAIGEGCTAAALTNLGGGERSVTLCPAAGVYTRARITRVSAGAQASAPVTETWEAEPENGVLTVTLDAYDLLLVKYLP